MLLWGWGVMNSTALKEAQATGYPATRCNGVWWAGAEPDVRDVGEGAIGLQRAGLEHLTRAKVIQDILKHVRQGPGHRVPGQVGSVLLYTRGVISRCWPSRSVRRAQSVWQGQGHDWRASALGHGKPGPDQKKLDALGFKA